MRIMLRTSGFVHHPTAGSVCTHAICGPSQDNSSTATGETAPFALSRLLVVVVMRSSALLTEKRKPSPVP